MLEDLTSEVFRNQAAFFAEGKLGLEHFSG